MAEKNLNTATLKQKTKPEPEIKAEMEKAAKTLKNDLVDVFIPDAYRSGLGDPVMFSVNGVRVEIPVGEKIKVPEAHALHVQRLMKGTVLTKNQRTLSPEEVYSE
jgi:hypothetical protein